MKRLLLALCLAALATGAVAQQHRPAAPPPVREEPTPEPPPAAYEPELLRLAEVLGTLSFLTGLCEQRGSESWQLRMAQLLDTEGTTVLRRERLAGAYNRGYIGHQPAHRTCTEASRLVIERLIQQGQKLTRELSIRYSG
ncbi:MAG: TIGR02301 family protein [Methylocystis sp.]|nr:TIGR02301 family protein [Methylocystis sp.]MCA3583352.1 TIGR02301 family protein [Methylocystis sp.]MCA3589420.1 TIGR02301 family protein [Methylocystis sp.]MCA3591871.1 TIGR02301 family protein [Methylocystis sp.]